MKNFLEYTADQKRALIAIALGALSISTFLFFASKGEAVEAPLIKIVESVPTKMLLVHVAGLVKKPGVYPVLEGSREEISNQAPKEDCLNNFQIWI
jgi:hypothetical protein